MMLMNKVSPATLCPSEENSSVDHCVPSEHHHQPMHHHYNSQSSHEFSQLSQGSFDLFPPSQQAYHSTAINHGMRDSRFGVSSSQNISQEKSLDKTHTDYLQRYLSVPKLPPSSSTPSIKSGLCQSSSNSSVDSSAVLNKSQYEQWRVGLAGDKHGSEAIVKAIVKVTKECAKELGETVNSLKQSLIEEATAKPHPVPTLTVDQLKQENEHLLKYQETCFGKLTEEQMEIKKILSEMIRRIDNRDSKLINLETKLDHVSKSLDERLTCLQSSLVSVMGRLNDSTATSNYTNHQTINNTTPLEETDINRPGSTCSQQSIENTSVQECVSLDYRTTTTPIVTINRSYSSSTQSGVDIDLTQISPLVAGGNMIGRCYNESGRNSTGRGQRVISTRIGNTPAEYNTTGSGNISRGQSCRRVAQRHSKSGPVQKPHQQQRTSIVTRNRAKRLRKDSISSDEEHCHVTVTMKTMDVKRSVRKSRNSQVTPTGAVNRRGFPVQKGPPSCVTDENVFVSSNSPVTTAVRRVPPSHCHIVRGREEEHKKRFNSSTIVKGSQDILKEIQASLLSKLT